VGVAILAVVRRVGFTAAVTGADSAKAIFVADSGQPSLPRGVAAMAACFDF
jgi:hypothetical protein